MKSDLYMDFIRNRMIPPEPPDGTCHEGTALSEQHAIEQVTCKVECQRRGAWGIIDRIWTGSLLDDLESRGVSDVLEIFAGAGFLTEALKIANKEQKRGIIISGTDDYSACKEPVGKVISDTRHDLMRENPNVIQCDALEAVAFSHADALLISWSPGGDATIIDACAAWGARRPIIYIGEGRGGNTAPAAFFDYYDYEILWTSRLMHNWYGMHGEIHYGYFGKQTGGSA